MMSEQYQFPFVITVNEFRLTKGRVEGKSIENYQDYGDAVTFAVANITIKNAGKNDMDRSFIPSKQLSPMLKNWNESKYEFPVDDIFVEREKKLEPGEKITGNLTYTLEESFFSIVEDESFYLDYSHIAEEDIKFEFPISGDTEGLKDIH